MTSHPFLSNHFYGSPLNDYIFEINEISDVENPKLLSSLVLEEEEKQTATTTLTMTGGIYLWQFYIDFPLISKRDYSIMLDLYLYKDCDGKIRSLPKSVKTEIAEYASSIISSGYIVFTV